MCERIHVAGEQVLQRPGPFSLRDFYFAVQKLHASATPGTGEPLKTGKVPKSITAGDFNMHSGGKASKQCQCPSLCRHRTASERLHPQYTCSSYSILSCLPSPCRPGSEVAGHAPGGPLRPGGAAADDDLPAGARLRLPGLPARNCRGRPRQHPPAVRRPGSRRRCR